MAEKTEFLQAIDDAILDADSLERFINGSEDETVLTRLSAEYPTLQKALKELFESGSIAGRFKTVEQLHVAGADLIDGDFALVADDIDVNNGVYIKENGAWRKTKYDYQKIVGELLTDYYGSTNYAVKWELGSFTDGGKYWNGLKNRMRLVGEKHLAINEEVVVECLNPELEVVLCSWNKEGVFNLGLPYASRKSKKIEKAFTVIARYKDQRNIDISLIKDTDFKITKKSVLKINMEELNNKVTQFEKWLKGEFNSKNLEWVNGSINGQGGIREDEIALKTRVRNKSHLEPHSGILNISVNNPKQNISVDLFDDKGVHIRYTGWLKGGLREDVNGYFSIAVSWDDNSAITPEDVDITINNAPEIITSIKNLESKVDYNRQALTDYVFKGIINIDWGWEVGSLTNTGQLWDRPDRARLRMASNSPRTANKIKVTSKNPDMSVNIVEFDKDNQFIKYNAFEQEQEREIDGYFNVLVRWNDDRAILPTDADVTLTVVTQGEQSLSTTMDDSKWYSAFPQISQVPFGHLIGNSLGVLRSEFDKLVTKYPGESKKEIIGYSSVENEEIPVYTLTPRDYEITVAITMHTHGNERYNPLGFYGLLHLMSSSGAKHPLIYWLRDKVRWIVVPFVSPTAIKDNLRGTRNSRTRINMNRDYDYLWEEGTVDKGIKPYELKETQAMRDFFIPMKDDIDYHLDLHDIPEVDFFDTSHHPFQSVKFIWMEEQNLIKKSLVEANNSNLSGNYIQSGGTTTNFFNHVLGIPSITPEHVTQHWRKRGLDADQQIGKATEQICAFLLLYKTMHERYNTKGSSMYTRLVESGFNSNDLGYYGWSKQKVLDAINGLGLVKPHSTLENVFESEGSPTNTQTFLIISGLSEDDNNSDLVLLRCLERIAKGDEMYVKHLQKCHLVVAPSFNKDLVPESQLSNQIVQLQELVNPDYTVVIRAPRFEEASKATEVRTRDSKNVSLYTKNSGIAIENSVVGIEQVITNSYASFNLGNETEKHAAYGHLVAKWVSLVLNDIASKYAHTRNEP